MKRKFRRLKRRIKRITPFVVRPLSILRTPRRMAQDLDWRVRKYLHPRRPDRVYDYRRDFLMTPVALNHLRHATSDYAETLDFLRKNKYGQRKALAAAGIPIPATFASPGEAGAATFASGTKFVVRPLRHSGGRDYRVTSVPTDFIGGAEYISELYEKKREYRVIFCFGRAVIWMRKHQNDGVSHEDPWGHVNSSFYTIQDVAGCKLYATDCVSRLAQFNPVRGAHIIAADILYNKKASKPYVVLELNACPGLAIDSNRATIAEIVRERRAEFSNRLQSLREYTVQHF